MSHNKNLNNLIDVNILKDIQDRLAEITGLAYNIVNFKGAPINDYSNFSSFCKKMRSTSQGFHICCDANAHAGLEAALRKKPYIFKCPAGLVDVAIPIIVNNTYLGAVFFGQVRTNNHSLSPINSLNYRFKNHKEYPELIDDYNNTLYIDYYKIESIASLVQTIVNQLVEKESLKAIEAELNFNNIKLMKEKENRIKLKEQLKTYNVTLLQSKVNPYFLFNVLNSISRLAVIENSPKTQEMIILLAEFSRYNSKHIGHKVILEEDIENIIRYLKMQIIRFKVRIKYEININDNIKELKIPSMILQCFVENAVIHGLCPKKEGGTIKIKGELLEGIANITITDDGVGISKYKLFLILDGSDEIKNENIGMSIYNVNEILTRYYGKNYRVEIKSEINVGTMIKLKFPFA